MENIGTATVTRDLATILNARWTEPEILGFAATAERGPDGLHVDVGFFVQIADRSGERLERPPDVFCLLVFGVPLGGVDDRQELTCRGFAPKLTRGKARAPL